MSDEEEESIIGSIIGMIVCYGLAALIFMFLAHLGTKAVDYVLKLETRIEALEKKVK